MVFIPKIYGAVFVSKINFMASINIHDRPQCIIIQWLCVTIRYGHFGERKYGYFTRFPEYSYAFICMVFCFVFVFVLFVCICVVSFCLFVCLFVCVLFFVFCFLFGRGWGDSVIGGGCRFAQTIIIIKQMQQTFSIVILD